MKLYTVSSIIPRAEHPIFGPEGEPIRVLYDENLNEVCCVRSDAGPATLGDMTEDDVIGLFAEPMDDGSGQYWHDEMLELLRARR